MHINFLPDMYLDKVVFIPDSINSLHSGILFAVKKLFNFM